MRKGRNKTTRSFDGCRAVCVGGPAHGTVYRNDDPQHRWSARLEVPGIYAHGVFTYRYATMAVKVDRTEIVVREGHGINRFEVSFYAYAKADPKVMADYIMSHAPVIDAISMDNQTADGLMLDPLATAMEMHELSCDFEAKLMKIDPLKNRKLPSGVWKLREEWNEMMERDEALLRAIGADGYVDSVEQ